MRKIYNLQEFAKICKTTERQILHDFSSIGIKMLKQGKFISREKINNIWNYDIENCEPREGTKEEFLIRLTAFAKKIEKNLPNEQWIDCYITPSVEVSNMGRIRNKIDKRSRKFQMTKQGYIRVSINNKNYFLHRIILQSFQPVDNYTEMTVDHIDGNRQNNKLENLRWLTNEENTQYMLFQRADLNKELTRIIQIYGYDKTLELLQNIK